VAGRWRRLGESGGTLIAGLHTWTIR